MKKTKFLLFILVLLILVTGCESKTKDNISFSEIINNTSISEKGLSGYRIKVSIIGKEFNQNYIVLNKNNKEYEITIIDENGDSETYSKKNGKYEKIVSDYSNSNKSKNDVSDNIELTYDYTNTNLFLNGLTLSSDDIKVEDYKINDDLYKKYSFPVSKETMNKILKPFSIEVNNNGSAFAIVDKNNRVYIIDYDFDDISINVSYTNFIK